MDTADILALFRQYRTNPSIRLRNRLVALNVGLVKKVANRFAKNSKLPYEELEAIGYHGLIKAVEAFDPSKGHQFSSYAVPRIRGAMLHWQRDRGTPGGFKLPRSWVEGRKRILAGEALSKMDAAELQRAQQALAFRQPASLDHRSGDDDGDGWEIAGEPVEIQGTLQVLTVDDILMALQFRPDPDQYFNATAICRRYGRRFYEWKRLPSTQSLIQQFETDCKKAGRSRNPHQAVVAIKGRKGASWVHRELAAAFLRWVSPETRIAVERVYSAAIEQIVA